MTALDTISQFNRGYASPPRYNAETFLRFWQIMNKLMKSRDLPELLYGEAKEWYTEYHRSGKCPRC
jgi:hypothetical protein